MKDYPVILSVAGSDPSGGAGIQADIKAISACGGYAAAAITAVTVQNTTGVMDVRYLPADVVAAQVRAVTADLSVDAVKIGMTGTVEIVEAVASELGNHRPRHIVVDPVMVSTSRDRLTLPEAVEALCSRLLPLCELLTPNVVEAERLTGMTITTVEDMVSAAEKMYSRYGCAVLVKGGDMPGQEDVSVDVMRDGDGHVHFSSKRLKTKNLHGTGCTLSSAIATYLGTGYALRTAVGKAIEYVHAAIEAGASQQIGHGNGPVRHFPKGIKHI